MAISQTEVLELEIDGLCCTECTASIEKALRRCRGIVDHQFLFAAEKAIVTYRPDQVGSLDIEQSIVNVGYAVRSRKHLSRDLTPEASSLTVAPSLLTVEIGVEGLCCMECAVSIEHSLQQLQGVAHHELLFGAEKVVAAFDPNQIRVDEIELAIRRTGYAIKQVRLHEEESVAPMTELSGRACGSFTGPSDAGVARAVMDGGSRGAAKQTWNSLRFWFVAVISLVVLGEVAGDFFGWFNHVTELVPFWLLIAAALIGGYPIFRRAFLGLRSRQANVDQMMTAGILAALSVGQFVSALLLVFFMSIAHYLEGYTVGKVRQAIRYLVNLAPTTARVVRGGQEMEMQVDQVKTGEIVRVRPGERIPVDGPVVGGRAIVNQATITGESLPVEKSAGDVVYAGTITEGGVLDIKMERTGENTTLGQIIHLVEHAETQKAPIQRFADTFTAWFLPTVLGIAGLTYLFSGHLLYAVAVMVAACPCAVGLATPLSVVSSVGSAARRGLLIKGGLTLETLARVDTLVVDKTGTLTVGEPRVTAIVPAEGIQKDQVLHLASSLERFSEHPLAGAVLQAATEHGLLAADVKDFVGMPGYGVSGQVGSDRFFLGNEKWLHENGAHIPDELVLQAEELGNTGHTVVYLARNDSCMGLLAVSDPIRPSAATALQALRNMGIRRMVLLSGDNTRVVAAVAAQLNIEDVHAECLPADKMAVVKTLQANGRTVAFIGDGVNDAPSLAQADVGMAMGMVGSDIATEAADVVLMRDGWDQVVDAVRIGRRTARTIRQDIWIGVGWNVVTMGLAAFGIIGPVIAAASEAMPDVFVALNSSRLYRRSQEV